MSFNNKLLVATGITLSTVVSFSCFMVYSCKLFSENVSSQSRLFLCFELAIFVCESKMCQRSPAELISQSTLFIFFNNACIWFDCLQPFTPVVCLFVFKCYNWHHSICSEENIFIFRLAFWYCMFVLAFVNICWLFHHDRMFWDNICVKYEDKYYVFCRSPGK